MKSSDFKTSFRGSAARLTFSRMNERAVWKWGSFPFLPGPSPASWARTTGVLVPRMFLHVFGFHFEIKQDA